MTGVEVVGAVTGAMSAGGMGMPLFGAAGQFQFSPLIGLNSHAASMQAAGHSGEVRFVAEQEYTLPIKYIRHGYFGGKAKDVAEKFKTLLGTIKGKPVAKIEVPLLLGFTYGHYVYRDDKGVEQKVMNKKGEEQRGIDNCYILLDGTIYNALNEGGSLSFVAITRGLADPRLVIQWNAALSGRGVLSQQHGQRSGQISLRVWDRQIAIDGTRTSKDGTVKKSFTMKYFHGLEAYDKAIQLV